MRNNSKGDLMFSFRIDKGLQDFIKFLKKNGYNVSDYLRDKLRELEKEYPERVKKQIDELEGRLREISNGNETNIKDRKVKKGFEVLQAMAAKRGYKPIGMETGAVPLIVKEVGVTEDKARDLLRTLNKVGVIEVKDKQIIVKQESRGGGL